MNATFLRISASITNITNSTSSGYAEVGLGLGAILGIVLGCITCVLCCVKGPEIDPRKPLSQGWLKG